MLINGNVEKAFKDKLGSYFLYKSSEPNNPFYMNPIDIEIIYEFDSPKFFKNLEFDGGLDTKMFNSTKLIDIIGLDGYVWEKITKYKPYNSIKVILKSDLKRPGLPSIIKKYDIQISDER